MSIHNLISFIFNCRSTETLELEVNFFYSPSPYMSQVPPTIEIFTYCHKQNNIYSSYYFVSLFVDVCLMIMPIFTKIRPLG